MRLNLDGLNMKKYVVFFLILIPFLTLSKENEMLVLKNEMRFTGKLRKIENNRLAFKTEKGIYWIPAGDVFYAKLDKPAKRFRKGFIEDKGSATGIKKESGDEESQTLIYMGYGIISNDSFLKNISLITPQDDDPKHKKIMEDFFRSANDDPDDPEYLKNNYPKVKLNLVRNFGIAFGSIILLGIIDHALFIGN